MQQDNTKIPWALCPIFLLPPYPQVRVSPKLQAVLDAQPSTSQPPIRRNPSNRGNFDYEQGVLRQVAEASARSVSALWSGRGVGWSKEVTQRISGAHASTAHRQVSSLILLLGL